MRTTGGSPSPTANFRRSGAVQPLERRVGRAVKEERYGFLRERIIDHDDRDHHATDEPRRTACAEGEEQEARTAALRLLRAGGEYARSLERPYWSPDGSSSVNLAAFDAIG
jgi:hypothetical protein